MQDYTKILAWRQACALTVSVREAALAIRAHDAPGLRSQLMRATMAISANIAEGAGRESRADFARFITIAISSASEVEHHLIVCADLSLADRALLDDLVSRCVQIRKMLFGFRRTLLQADFAENRKSSSSPDRSPSR